jgi:hypothetical protein
MGTDDDQDDATARDWRDVKQAPTTSTSKTNQYESLMPTTSHAASPTSPPSTPGATEMSRLENDLAARQTRSRSSDLLPLEARAATRDRSFSPSRARNRPEVDTRLRALRAENRRLKNRNTCRHCRQRPVSLTLLPCGHFCFCQECGSTFSACPVCRKTILADVRTFVA